MTTRAPAKKRPALGSALAASLEGERSHLDRRFARAEEIFGDGTSERGGQPDTAPVLTRPAEPCEDDKVDRVGFSLLKKETQLLDAMFAEAVREAPRTTTSEVIRAALAVFHRLPLDRRMEEIRKLETPKLRRRRF